MNKLINDLLKEKSELKKYNIGVPFLGNKANGFKYTKNVRKIINGYSFYNEKLFLIDKKEGAIDNCSLDSGNPLRYPIFKPIIKESKKSNNKYILNNYPRASGDKECRKRIALYMNNQEFINLNEEIDESNIIFSLSTSHALSLILQVIAKPKDVVIIPSPNYGLFTVMCERFGLDVEYIYMKPENNFLIDPNELSNLIDSINKKLRKKYQNNDRIPRVIAFLNENPNNPLGKVMGIKESNIAKKIANICKKNNLFIIDDLVYKDTIYDFENKVIPLGNYDAFDNSISLFGLSKSFGGAGLRAGIIVANKYIIKGIKNLIFQEMDSVPLMLSYYCAGAYNDTKYRNRYYKKYFKKLIKKYKYNYNLLKYLVTGESNDSDKYLGEINKYSSQRIKKWDGIEGIKLINGLTPESGFFAIVDFTDIIKLLNLKNIKNESDLYIYLYTNVGIKYIMGNSMGWYDNKQYVGRINYAEDKEIIVKTFIKFKNFIEKEKMKFNNGKTSLFNNK